MATSIATTPLAGNTIQPMVKLPKARDWQLTLNEVDKYNDLKGYLTGLKSNNYYIACKEIAPTTGHEHIHIYVQFTNSISLSIKKTCGAHIEKCRGTPQQNVEYIKKDGNILDEIGTVRKSGCPSIADVKKMTHEERDELPIQYANVVRHLNEESEESIDIDDIHKEVKVYYIYGESGVGKSKRAYELAKELGFTKIHQVKHESTFWHGLGHGMGCAIYDDFRDSHMKASEFINFIDYNVHPMNKKGGSVLNRFDTIIITSVQDPVKIYSNMDDEPRKQWMRRIKVQLMTDCQDDSEAVSNPPKP